VVEVVAVVIPRGAGFLGALLGLSLGRDITSISATGPPAAIKGPTLAR
jgi:hypothetical protein